MKPVICLMGPTAAGKTPLAIELVQRFPCEIVSVDSAMVYRDMNIGTAKPEPEVLKIAPHRLIDIRDPAEVYSAGDFRRDVLQAITEITAQQKIPLLVGGTMLYFRVLQQGLADLPTANTKLRYEMQIRAQREGWEVLHAELAKVDPQAAQRIQPRDSQRIQRALEVYMLTGKTITQLQAQDTNPLAEYRLLNLGLAPTDRNFLHQRIAQRFAQMLEMGFIAEVEKLFARRDLNPDLPSVRSVGYKQMWDYLSGLIDFSQMTENALAATRQLAKRQMTWLRSWPNLYWIAAEEKQLIDNTTRLIQAWLRE